ncbi:phosphoglycerate mutase [Clostridium sp. CAG:793]|nr:phosphoglycerate mutase [Clostridium sp. CAG:793]
MIILEKENYGDLDELAELGKVKKNPYTIEQIIDRDLKCTNGESMNDTKNRFEEKINEVINNNLGKRLAIVSHGAAIKFYLMNWCELIGKDIEYKGNIIKIESPSITKLIFDENMQLKEMYNI